MFKNVVFETSVFSKTQILDTDLKQIVLVGKSNVGKSSFINTVANQKRLCYVGNTPGKTKSINYFNVNNEFYLVDLPGYGYSKMSQVEKTQTNNLIDAYITNNDKISHILFLIDIRHEPSNNDKLMYDWLVSQNLPFTIIANKADKIAKTKIDEYILKIRKGLFAKEEIIPFSSQTRINVDIIENLLFESLK
ncbi:MAG: ribosome biogenesis GTP-binding protein YihA/YsxC [Clostridia bacterium]|nr:ribosome biogenesis GTP-binding protein YihA/YsxC [Clostridia bacterium]